MVVVVVVVLADKHITWRWLLQALEELYVIIWQEEQHGHGNCYEEIRDRVTRKWELEEFMYDKKFQLGEYLITDF